MPTLTLLGDLLRPYAHLTAEVRVGAETVGWTLQTDTHLDAPGEAVLIDAITDSTHRVSSAVRGVRALGETTHIGLLRSQLDPKLETNAGVVVVIAEDDVVAQVSAWLRDVPAVTGPDQRRAAVEALVGWWSREVLDNAMLVRRVEHLERELAGARDELSELRRDVLAQWRMIADLRDALDALSRTADVDAETASWPIKALRKVGPHVVTLLLTMGGTYAGTVAAQDEPTALRDLAMEIDQQCTTTLIVLGGEDPPP